MSGVEGVEGVDAGGVADADAIGEDVDNAEGSASERGVPAASAGASPRGLP